MDVTGRTSGTALLDCRARFLAANVVRGIRIRKPVLLFCTPPIHMPSFGCILTIVRLRRSCNMLERSYLSLGLLTFLFIPTRLQPLFPVNPPSFSGQRSRIPVLLSLARHPVRYHPALKISLHNEMRVLCP